MTTMEQHIQKIYKENERFRAALEQIAAIEDKMYGPDWEEIEQARDIANKALGRNT